MAFRKENSLNGYVSSLDKYFSDGAKITLKGGTLDLSNDDSNVINSVIDGNMFKNCISDDNTSAIDLGINTKYISVINNKFDEDLTNYTNLYLMPNNEDKIHEILFLGEFL